MTKRVTKRPARASISKRAALAIWLAIAGCDAEAEDAPEAQRELPGLARGARGEEVARVNEALFAQGYFPNAELAEAFPSWTPAVAEGPAANDVFDERTEEAVGVFQAHHALPITGVVDDATRDRMTALRCGNPVMHGEAADAKWHHDAQWSAPYPRGGTYTYRIPNIPPGWTRAQASSAVASAFAVWTAQAGVDFVERPPTESTHAIIDFANVDGPGGAGGICYDNGWGGQRHSVVIDTSEGWVFGGTPSVNPTLVHELGHMLGFNHSGVFGAILYPVVSASPAPVQLADDDLGVLVRRYRDWSALPGSAHDVGAGDGGAWVIGTDPQPFGFGIYRFDDPGFVGVDGSAVRIAVSDVPWVVNNLGDIYQRYGVTTGNPNGTGWVHRDSGPGAIDLGVAVGQLPWMVSREPRDGAGNFIRRWNGASWSLVSGLSGHRIAVGNDGSVFVANRNGQVFERTGTSSLNPVGTGWRALGGLAPNVFGNETGFARDVAVARGGIGVATGTADGVPFTFFRQEQPATTFGGPPAVAFDRWMGKEGGGNDIGVSLVHAPFITTSTTAIRRMTR